MNMCKVFELNYWNILLLKYTFSYYVVEEYIHFPDYLPFEKRYISRQKSVPFFFPNGSEFLNICKIIHTWYKVKKQFCVGAKD